MKQIFIFTVIFTSLICSCASNEDYYNDLSSIDLIEEKEISFNATTNLLISRATYYDETTNGNMLTDFYVFDNGENITHQVYSENPDSFGIISHKFSYGEHNLSFIMTRAKDLVYNDSVLNFVNIKPTFGETLKLNINASTTNQNIQLNRLVSKLTFKTLDNIPSNADSVYIKIYNYNYGINVYSFKGKNNNEYLTKINLKSVLNSNATISLFLFTSIYKEDYNVDVDFIIYDKNKNILCKHELKNIPICSNKITTISGNYFGDKLQTVLSMNGIWDEGNERNISDF